MLSEILFNLSVLTSSIFVSKCHNTYRVREQEEVNGSEIKYLLILATSDSLSGHTESIWIFLFEKWDYNTLKEKELCDTQVAFCVSV